MIVFIGSYTEYIVPGFGGKGAGIYTVDLDTNSGALKVLHTKKTTNPSYMALSDDNKFLYCVNETLEPLRSKIQSFKVNKDYSLELVDEQSINGSLSCHIAFVNNSLVVSNYGSGSVVQCETDGSGKILNNISSFQHVGRSINEERQEGPHAHHAVLHPNEQEVFVCDLGLDLIKSYTFHENKLVAKPTNDIEISKGNGPRHLVFNRNGSLGYVINELSGKVMVLEEREGRFRYVESYDTLPLSGEKIPSASAIRIHPNGRYLYAANRALDSITAFKIVKNELEVLNYYYTDGITLREFNISNDGKWLIACHQDSRNTVVFEIKEDGILIKKSQTKNIVSPVCAVFLK